MAMQTGSPRRHRLGPDSPTAWSLSLPGRDGRAGLRDPRTFRLSAAAACLLACVVSVFSGCSNQSANSAKADRRRAERDPRATFERVVEEFREYYRSVDILLPTSSGESGGERLKVQILVDDVSHTIGDAPPEDGAALRAEMTVRTRTQFALLDAELDRDQEEDSSGSGSGGSESANGSSTGSGEQRRSPLGPLPDEFLNSRNREQVHKVAFAYRDDRWELVPQEDLDPSIKSAVELALRSQEYL